EHWDYVSAWMPVSTFPAQEHYPSVVYLACLPFLGRLVSCWHIAAMDWRAAWTVARTGRWSKASMAVLRIWRRPDRTVLSTPRVIQASTPLSMDGKPLPWW